MTRRRRSPPRRPADLPFTGFDALFPPPRRPRPRGHGLRDAAHVAQQRLSATLDLGPRSRPRAAAAGRGPSIGDLRWATHAIAHDPSMTPQPSLEPTESAPARAPAPASWLAPRAETQGFPRYVEVIRAGRWIIIASMVICVGAAIAYLVQAKNVYEAGVRDPGQPAARPARPDPGRHPAVQRPDARRRDGGASSLPPRAQIGASARGWTWTPRRRACCARSTSIRSPRATSSRSRPAAPAPARRSNPPMRSVRSSSPTAPIACTTRSTTTSSA